MLGALLAILFVATGAIAQMADKRVPELSGPPQEMGEVEAHPIPKWVVDDVRKERAYPDQPPVIPHSIEGYHFRSTPTDAFPATSANSRRSPARR